MIERPTHPFYAILRERLLAEFPPGVDGELDTDMQICLDTIWPLIEERITDRTP